MTARPVRRRAPGRRVLALLVGLALAVGAGVLLLSLRSGDADAAGAGSAGSGPEQRAVRGDYLAYWDALLAANADGDPGRLGEFAAGGQLAQVRTNVERLKAQGVVARGPVGHRIDRVELRSGYAYLVDCVDLRGWVQYEAASGAVRPGQLIDRPRQLARYTLAPRDGRWLVTDSTVDGTC